MAVKAKKSKKNYKEWLTQNAVRIKCCYCDIKDTCERRERKEKWEREGVMTRCIFTPNKKGKKKKKKSKAQRYLPESR